MDSCVIRFTGRESIKLDDNSGVMFSNFRYMLIGLSSERRALIGFFGSV